MAGQRTCCPGGKLHVHWKIVFPHPVHRPRAGCFGALGFDVLPLPMPVSFVGARPPAGGGMPTGGASG